MSYVQPSIVTKGQMRGRLKQTIKTFTGNSTPYTIGGNETLLDAPHCLHNSRRFYHTQVGVCRF